MRRTKAEAEETRLDILAAAERIFFVKGLAGTTFEDVAGAAGVTRGAIYWHFDNKVELFLALYESLPLSQKDMFGPEIGQEDFRTLDLIERTTTEWMESLSKDVQRQRIFTILFRCDFSQGLERVLARQQEMDDHHASELLAAFEKAAAAGELNPVWQPEIAAKTLYWTIKGLCSDWLLWGRRFDLDAAGRTSVGNLMASFKVSRLA